MKGRLAAAVVVLASLYSATAVAAATPSVAQGDKIIGVHGGAECSVGLIDPLNLRIVTAGHCKQADTEWAIRLPGGELLGMGSIQSLFDFKKNQQDIGFIEVVDPATLGANFDVANTVDLSPVPGERVCTYSTQRQQKSCGEILAVGDYMLLTTGNLALSPGDSGTALWTERGIVGILSGPNFDEDRHEITSFRFTRLRSMAGGSLVTKPVPENAEPPALEKPVNNDSWQSSSFSLSS